MKTRNIIFRSVTTLHIALFLGLGLTGCKNPKVLKSRGYIPDPLPAPAPKTARLPIQTQIKEKTIIKQTITPLPPEPISQPIPAYKPFPKLESKALTHKVTKGESFWTIARKYQVSMKELAAYNKLPLNHKLNANTILRIPPGGIKPDGSKPHIDRPRKTRKIIKTTTIKTKYSKPLTPGAGRHIVRKGESLWSISRIYNISYIKLAKLNNMSLKQRLYEGNVLILPAGVKAVTKPSPQPRRQAPKPAPAAKPTPSPVETTPSPAATFTEEKTTETDVKTPGSDTTILKESTETDDTSILNEVLKKDPPTVPDDSETKKLIDSISDDSSDITDNDEEIEDEVDKLLGTTKSATPKVIPAAREHEVLNNGQTLEDIAILYTTTPEELYKLNPAIPPKTKLKEGQKIKVP